MEESGFDPTKPISVESSDLTWHILEAEHVESGSRGQVLGSLLCVNSCSSPLLPSPITMPVSLSVLNKAGVVTTVVEVESSPLTMCIDEDGQGR